MDMHRALFAYKLKSNEKPAQAAERFGAKDAHELSAGFVRIAVELDAEIDTQWAAEDFSEQLTHKGAKVQSVTTGGVKTYRVQNLEETFDVVARGKHLFVTDVDGFGGVSEVNNDYTKAFAAAYDAYRAVLAQERG